MMAQVHSDAIKASRAGKPQYVLRGGAYIVWYQDSVKMLNALQGGYKLQAKYVNGVCHSEWDMDIAHNAELFAEYIAGAVKTPFAWNPASRVLIHAQEYYNEQATERERISMTVMIWREKVKEVIQITPDPSTSSAEAVEQGQLNGAAILNLLLMLNCQQDVSPLIRELEADIASTLKI